ncbi:peptidase [bacterium C-53]|nr:peptidase [Lachnospiraceae bacterium]NBI01482.1 peptidase [Lachnospiraceae bacterium]RKJ12790.1 peptidase [bacterium C-53]
MGMINQALNSENPYDIVPSRDTDGHGTALAQIAAGSFQEGEQFCGASPECVIAVVKCKEAKPYLKEFYAVNQDAFAIAETDIMTGVQYLNALAQQYNMPLVICLSVGTNQGDHNGRSSLAQFLDVVALNDRRCAVTAGGNEGNARHHFEGSGEYSEAEIKVGENESGFFLELWASSPDIFSISIRSPYGESVPRITSRIGGSHEFRFIYDETVVLVDYRIVERESGGELISMRFQNPSPGIWSIGVYGSATNRGSYHMWLPLTGFISDETYFLRSSPDVTLTEPSNAFGPITVTGYNEITGGSYTDSSRGFTRNGSEKPDFAAPAVNVSTNVGMYTGTSVAAAITAGAAADFLEWAVVKGNEPIVNSDDVKNYFKRGAVREPGITYPNKQEGFGRLNLKGVFDSLTQT